MLKVIFLLLVSLSLFSQENIAKSYKNLNGYAQGTSYSISFELDTDQNYQLSIDSIFKVVNKNFSLWDSTSTLTLINRNKFGGYVDKDFKKLFFLSNKINKITNGYFDIRVGPLVNAWGFGKINSFIKPNANQIDSLKKLITSVELTTDQKIIKGNQNLQLDFNGIAQGYTVDLIADFFESKNVKNYLIEVGGEILAKGKNQNNEFWKIGIENPSEMDQMKLIVSLKNKALATSGSYRRFWEKDGLKFSHAIDPFTGYPVHHNMLSVSVVAKNCAEADAFATAFLVMGLEKAKKIAKNNKIEFFAIYDKNKTFRTKNFGK